MEEDGLSSIIPSSHEFDAPKDSEIYKEEDEDSDDEIERDNDIRDAAEDFFEDVNSDDESSDNVSYNKSFEHAEKSSVKGSYDPFLSINESGHSSISRSRLQSNRLEEQSVISEFEDSKHSGADNSNNHSNDDDTDDEQNNINGSEIDPDTDKHVQQQNSPNSFMSNNISSYQQENRFDEFSSNISENYKVKNVHKSSPSSRLEDKGLHQEYNKLQVLYATRGEELEQVKKEEMHLKMKFEHEIKSLKLNLALVEGKKDELFSSLSKSENLLAGFEKENKELKGKLSSAELQLSAEKEAKDFAVGKLQSCEITVESLEKKLKGLMHSENAVRLQTQNEGVIKELKLRYQKEIFQLKENIDKLQGDLSAKINESEGLLSEVLQLRKKCEELQIDKSVTINQLSASLQASQKQCQELLESGTVAELSILKLQFQHLQKEKSKLEKQNSDLKDENKSLKEDLRTSAALNGLGNENEQSQAHQNNKKENSTQKESNLKSDLHQYLKKTQLLRQQNSSLKEKLDELKNKLLISEEKAKLFESRFNSSEGKRIELEKKLDEVLPFGSIPISQHEKELTTLKIELLDFQRKMNDITEKLKVSSSREKKLFEANKNLKNNIAEMQKKHENGKEECREKYLELHESAIKKLNDELTSKADKELKTACLNYNNKISDLQREIKVLNDQLYDAKDQYCKVFAENKILLSKIDSITIPKECQEIERDVRDEYEKKINDMKEHIQKQNQNYIEKTLKAEVETVQEEWTKHKMLEVKEFVNTIKQDLEERFAKCLDDENSKFQSALAAERENFILEYQEKLSILKQQHEAEKESLKSRLWESFQIKWKNEVKELQQSHQHEIQNIRQKLDDRISSMQNEIRILNENLAKKSEDIQEMQNLQGEFSRQKKAWETEKSNLIRNEYALNEKMSIALEVEKKLKIKVKKYYRYTESLERKHQEKMKRLLKQNEELQKAQLDKEKQLLVIEEQCRQDKLELEQKQQKHVHGRNAGSQTEEQVVSRKTFLNVQDMFIQCLKNIADEIKTYLMNSRKRAAEQFRKALYYYHDHITSKIFPDMFKDVSSFTPSLCIPRMNVNSCSSSASTDISPITVQQKLNAKHRISNSTPNDNLESRNSHKRHGSYQSEETKVKTVHNTKSSSDTAIRFEDISFDFLPIGMPDSGFMSTKLPDYSMRGGLFNHGSVLKNSFPQKPSPISSIK